MHCIPSSANLDVNPKIFFMHYAYIPCISRRLGGIYFYPDFTLLYFALAESTRSNS